MLKESRIIVISSVSGGGKTTLINEVVKDYPDLYIAITATSRQPRKGEENGDHYFFYTQNEFQDGIQNNEFLEFAEVHGNYYGVPRGPVMENVEAGNSVILNIDVQGMRAVKNKLGKLVSSIFIMPPDLDVWEKRLRKRDTDTEEEIRKRLQQGVRELDAAFEYDYRLVNKDLGIAVQEMIEVMKKEGAI